MGREGCKNNQKSQENVLQTDSDETLASKAQKSNFPMGKVH